MKVNGKQLKFDVPPVNQNGRVLVPLRSIFEELGADVRWDEQTQTITAQLGVTELILHVGKDEAEINGERITLDVPPQIKNGRTLVPLRFVSEALGAEVKWNNLIQLASIN
ncbi:MAG: copper amine oxidase [Firmicutes bacterium HGW-Firmicutes-8]|nr:MAG: copper amine oxidase [Firmicutes bacterium HGW-Firmicutes-8]